MERDRGKWETVVIEGANKAPEELLEVRAEHGDKPHPPVLCKFCRFGKPFRASTYLSSTLPIDLCVCLCMNSDHYCHILHKGHTCPMGELAADN